MESPMFSVFSRDFQNECVCEEKERLQWVETVLPEAVETHDIVTIRHCCAQLNSYFFFGFVVPKWRSAALIKLLFPVLDYPELPPEDLIKMMSLLKSLLNGASRVLSLQLSVDPLLNILQKHLYLNMSSLHNVGKVHKSLSLEFFQFLPVLKRFLEPGYESKILRRFREFLSPRDTAMCTGVFLCLLLPTSHFLGRPVPFLDELFQIWGIDQKLVSSAVVLPRLIGELAMNNVGALDLGPFLPFLCARFLDFARLPLVGAVYGGERTGLYFPKGWFTGKAFPSELTGEFFAQILVFSHSPSCPALTSALEQLLASAAHYFHPSQPVSTSSTRLVAFVRHLARFLVLRVRWDRLSHTYDALVAVRAVESCVEEEEGVGERYGLSPAEAEALLEENRWGCCTHDPNHTHTHLACPPLNLPNFLYFPAESRLDPAVVEHVVGQLLPLVKMQLFSKNVHIRACAAIALTYLMGLAPESVIPALVETAVTALQAVNETHQLNTVLSLLRNIMPCLADFWRFPNGIQYLPELLRLLLPGLDSNDKHKTSLTVKVLIGFLEVVPLCGVNHNYTLMLNRNAPADPPLTTGARSPLKTKQQRKEEAMRLGLPEDYADAFVLLPAQLETDYLCRANIQRLVGPGAHRLADGEAAGVAFSEFVEEWALLLIKQVSAVARANTCKIFHLLEVFFTQVSDEIHQRCFPEMLAFLNGFEAHLLPDIHHFFESAVSFRSHLTLPLFFETFTSGILHHLRTDPPDSQTAAHANSVNLLAWKCRIVLGVLGAAGALQYMFTPPLDRARFFPPHQGPVTPPWEADTTPYPQLLRSLITEILACTNETVCKIGLEMTKVLTRCAFTSGTHNIPSLPSRVLESTEFRQRPWLFSNCVGDVCEAELHETELFLVETAAGSGFESGPDHRSSSDSGSAEGLESLDCTVQPELLAFAKDFLMEELFLPYISTATEMLTDGNVPSYEIVHVVRIILALASALNPILWAWPQFCFMLKEGLATNAALTPAILTSGLRYLTAQPNTFCDIPEDILRLNTHRFMRSFPRLYYPDHMDPDGRGLAALRVLQTFMPLLLTHTNSDRMNSAALAVVAINLSPYAMGSVSSAFRGLPDFCHSIYQQFFGEPEKTQDIRIARPTCRSVLLGYKTSRGLHALPTDPTLLSAALTYSPHLRTVEALAPPGRSTPPSSSPSSPSFSSSCLNRSSSSCRKRSSSSKRRFSSSSSNLLASSSSCRCFSTSAASSFSSSVTTSLSNICSFGSKIKTSNR
eukprot:GCRY01002573.1.p1 GENE.GCRY01002573.1~~GCRY01002573.1.p1  ORF type:complete len:1261 (+),score=277.81 GCRY01002573.1:302-4084(+)